MKFSIIDPYLKQSNVIARENLPEGMRILADELVTRSSQEEALRFAYDTLTQKYRGYRTLTFLRLDRLCITSMETLWNIRGFLHCHHINYLLRTLLLASGQFQVENIEARWTGVWFISPHQYLIVTLNNGQKIEVDVWARAYGIPFGSHAHGLQSGSLIASTLPEKQ
jgi:hypothetical protein